MLNLLKKLHRVLKTRSTYQYTRKQLNNCKNSEYNNNSVVKRFHLTLIQWFHFLVSLLIVNSSNITKRVLHKHMVMVIQLKQLVDLYMVIIIDHLMWIHMIIWIILNIINLILLRWILLIGLKEMMKKDGRHYKKN